MEIIQRETSRRITSLRFLLIVFVVFIHANLQPDDAINYYHYDFVQPEWIRVVKNFIGGTLGGAAVPLFFFFASFLQFSKNDDFPVLLKKRFSSIFLPYVVWTLITILLYFFAQSIPQTASFFQNPVYIIKNWRPADFLKAFAYQKIEVGTKSPFVYQFWFLRDLMIFILLSPVLKFLCRKFPALIFFFAFVALLKNIPIFFTVSSAAFFYYVAGFFCAEYKIDFFSIADKIKFSEFAVLIFLGVFFDLNFGGKFSFGALNTFVSCLFFLKLSKIFVSRENLYKKLETLSGFSFFLYAIHAPFLGTAVNKISCRIIPLRGIFCLVQFFAASVLTVTAGTFAGFVLKKICPKFFSLLNGGRK